MTRGSRPICVLALFVLHAFCRDIALASDPPAPVAQVLGQSIGCQELGGTSPKSCANALLTHAFEVISRDYIERRRLQASDDEIRTLAAYNDRFELHDRDQRARKLAEIDERLSSTDLPVDDRHRLLEFREVLARLARFDADVDAGRVSRGAPSRASLGAIIEEVKLNIALFARFGGVLGQAAYGPYPHEARMALVADYIAKDLVRIHDEIVRMHFEQAMREPPRVRYRGAFPDFTPYWERPLAPSYMPW